MMKKFYRVSDKSEPMGVSWVTRFQTLFEAVNCANSWIAGYEKALSKYPDARQEEQIKNNRPLLGQKILIELVYEDETI